MHRINYKIKEHDRHNSWLVIYCSHQNICQNNVSLFNNFKNEKERKACTYKKFSNKMWLIERSEDVVYKAGHRDNEKQ